jgi:hypothetical protein
VVAAGRDPRSPLLAGIAEEPENTIDSDDDEAGRLRPTRPRPV